MAVSAVKPPSASAATGQVAGFTATVTLSGKDNKGQIPILELTLVSASDPAKTYKFTTKSWKASKEDAMGIQTMSGQVPALPDNFGEPGAVLVKLLNNTTPFVAVREYVLDGFEAGAKRILPDALEGPASLLYKRIHQSHPVDKFLITGLKLQLPAGPVSFNIHSFVRYTQGERIFFNAKPYLPNDTPAGIKALRQQELANLRGEDPKTGQPTAAASQRRKPGDRIYDFDVYNDLGDANKPAEIRRILGGPNTETSIGYPRRLRTGRPIINGKYESRDHPESKNPWMPDDEEFPAVKAEGFLRTTVGTILQAVPSVIDAAFKQKPDINDFSSFNVVHALFEDDHRSKTTKARRDQLPLDFSGAAEQSWIKSNFAGIDLLRRNLETNEWPAPAVRRNRALAWGDDREFARATLAGQNPCMIERIDIGSKFLDGTLFLSSEQQGHLELPASIAELQANGRLFGIDMSSYTGYISRINAQAGKARYQYAGKAILFLDDTGVLMPAAIHLSYEKKKGQIESRVYTPSLGMEEWSAARMIFASLDSGVHQLISHWLRTHACVEPFGIALHRTLSTMHPVHKLMLPCFRHTISINAQARESLINAGGQIEGLFTPGKLSMELSGVVYDASWTFDSQDLEQDLLSRKMLKVDASGKPVRDADGKVEPLLDYPYAQDGLDLYYAFTKYYTDYLSIYYSDTGAAGKPKVTDDPEVMAFWKEAKEKGHPDKKAGWPELKDIASLARILTIVSWLGSVHHAAVNFGQYAFSGWMPNRPSFVRKPIPTEGTQLEALQDDYEKTVLQLVSSPIDTLTILIVVKLLSTHSPDELYISDPNPYISDVEALKVQEVHIANLTSLQATIEERNKPGASRVRSEGGVTMPYTLLTPFVDPSKPLDGNGVPTSISI